MGWGLGANDSANVFGTAVATRVISYRNAVILTAIFVVIGAWAQGPMVMGLFTKLSDIDPTEAILAALASAIAMHAMTYWGIPTSSSQATVGAVIGIGLLDGSANLQPLLKVFGCWVAAPIGAALFPFVLLPLYFTGYQPYLETLERIRSFNPSLIGLAHQSPFSGKAAQTVLGEALRAAPALHDRIRSAPQSDEELAEILFRENYRDEFAIYTPRNILNCCRLLVKRSRQA